MDHVLYLKPGLRFSALHGAWGVFKRCSVTCQVALSVLHWSVGPVHKPMLDVAV